MPNDYKITDFGEIEPEKYLEVMLSIARADGRIGEQELDFLDIQAKLFNLDIDQYMNSECTEINYERIANLTRITRQIIIRDCITLGYIDGNFSKSDRYQIIEIAEKIGLNRKDVFEIESWLNDMWSVMRTGERIFSG